MSNKTFSYFLAAGWAENRWKTHQLLDGLEEAGGIAVNDIHSAAVIIAHSAGGHVIPSIIKAKLIVLIAPSFVVDQPYMISVLEEYVMDTIYYFRRFLIYPWLLKNIYYLFFGIFHPVRTFQIYKKVRQPLAIDELKNYRVLLIRNKNDFFCSPKISQLTQKYKNINFVELPGRHDNCWIDPQPYVDLILKEL